MEFLKNQYFRSGVMLLLGLYILGVFPTLNRQLRPLFVNPLFQILVLVGIIQLSYYDLTLALLLSLAFISSIHFSNYVNLEDLLRGGQRTGGEPWNDSTWGSEPMGYNVNKHCSADWGHQCQGVNTFGNEFNTQGMNQPGGYDRGDDLASADF